MTRLAKPFLIIIILLNSFITNSQSINIPDENKYCFKFTSSYVNPFIKDNSFERIGSILAFKGGWAYKLAEKKYIGFEAGTSLFFPVGGGPISDPQVLPSIKFEFTNTEQIVTLLTVGHIYNPSLGFKLDAEYIYNSPSQDNYILSQYLLGVNQTFDLRPNENSNSPPSSWIIVSGLQFVKPLKNKWLIVLKSGLGARGDTSEKTKLVWNGDLVLRWNYISAVAQYTNAVPDRGFPSYFVSVLSLDITKVWRQYISKKDCKIGSALMGY